ncbi:MAG: hypothetical protein JW881_03475 [Spirochaetales bacterium]|nr:hypothetical protein [Spirochaetales bacterium]
MKKKDPLDEIVITHGIIQHMPLSPLLFLPSIMQCERSVMLVKERKTIPLNKAIMAIVKDQVNNPNKKRDHFCKLVLKNYEKLWGETIGFLGRRKDDRLGRKALDEAWIISLEDLKHSVKNSRFLRNLWQGLQEFGMIGNDIPGEEKISAAIMLENIGFTPEELLERFREREEKDPEKETAIVLSDAREIVETLTKASEALRSKAIERKKIINEYITFQKEGFLIENTIGKTLFVKYYKPDFQVYIDLPLPKNPILRFHRQLTILNQDKPVYFQFHPNLLVKTMNERPMRRFRDRFFDLNDRVHNEVVVDKLGYGHI